MANQPPAIVQLLQVDMLPPLPATAATLLRLAADPDVEIDALATVIQHDPPLTARILGIANSAFYAPRQPIITVKSAIIGVLGLNLVRNIAFGMALTSGLSTARCAHFDLTGYWAMALGTADLASGLARAATVRGAPDPDAAYLVGLLHNLGELLLAHCWPQQFDEALRRHADQQGSSLVDQEQAVLGLDHWQAGAFLVRHWQLPAIVGDLIEALGSGSAEPRDDALLSILQAARAWVGSVYDGRSSTLQVVGVEDAYCEYRSSAFLDRFDALKSLAASMS